MAAWRGQLSAAEIWTYFHLILYILSANKALAQVCQSLIPSSITSIVIAAVVACWTIASDFLHLMCKCRPFGEETARTPIARERGIQDLATSCVIDKVMFFHAIRPASRSSNYLSLPTQSCSCSVAKDKFELVSHAWLDNARVYGPANS